MYVLQIVNGYLDSKLYELLFSALDKQSITNEIYVPVNQTKTFGVPLKNNVHISRCYNSFDRLFFFIKQRKMLLDVERKELTRNIDLVHAHTVFSGGYLARKIYKKHGIPYIVAVRNTDVNLFFKKLFFMRPIGLKVLNDAKQIIFLSPTYRENVTQTYIPAKYRASVLAKSQVIPNGISSIFFQNRLTERSRNSDTVRLIYVGNLSTNKNFETTVEAANILKNKGIDVEVTAVGEILEEKYRDLIEKNSFVKYYKKSPQSEIIRFLQQSDIFVMPSHHETFGLVYAEAVSQGLPVLYTKGQGFDGHFSDGTVGYAVSDSSPTELAEKIEAVLKNYAELSKNCLTLAERFQWDQIAEQYCEIYAVVTKGTLG